MGASKSLLGLVEHPLSAAWGDKDVVMWRGKKGVPRLGNSHVVHLCDGMVIGGWEKVLTAARRSGKKRFVEIRGMPGGDPLKWILDRHRDFPNGPKKAQAIVNCAKWLPPGRPTRFEKGRSSHDFGVTAESMAEYAGMSVRSIVRAKATLRHRRYVSGETKMPHWRDELDLAVAHAEDLQEQLDDCRAHLQEYADRALPHTELTEAISYANKSRRAMRMKLIKLERKLKIIERDSKMRLKVIRKLEQRLRKRGKHEWIQGASKGQAQAADGVGD